MRRSGLCCSKTSRLTRLEYFFFYKTFGQPLFFFCWRELWQVSIYPFENLRRNHKLAFEAGMSSHHFQYPLVQFPSGLVRILIVSHHQGWFSWIWMRERWKSTKMRHQDAEGGLGCLFFVFLVLLPWDSSPFFTTIWGKYFFATLFLKHQTNEIYCKLWKRHMLVFVQFSEGIRPSSHFLFLGFVSFVFVETMGLFFCCWYTPED